MYFTGKHEIFSAETELGTIKAGHVFLHNFGGPSGVYIKNTIRTSIEFREPEILGRAIEHLLDLLHFLEVVAGRPQNVGDIQITLNTNNERPPHLKVHWNMFPIRDRDEEVQKSHPRDVLVNGGLEPNEFGEVLARWLTRKDTWRDARGRFASCFAKQNSYDVDRLIAAANMFDILPPDAVPANTTLSEELLNAKANADSHFWALPRTPESAHILIELKRLGQPNLKRKIRHRAAAISSVLGDRFPDLDRVIDEAVECRNHYVHGSKTKIDYNANFDLIFFFVSTLEFVFAASDLIDAGWDIAAWISHGTTMSHPFGTYRVNYLLNLAELNRVLES